MHSPAENSATFSRLSDRILSALELAIDQKDVLIAEHLLRVLEMAMTRNAGGAKFKEKRDYPPAIAEAVNRLEALKK
jgi:hypothetical protein